MKGNKEERLGYLNKVNVSSGEIGIFSFTIISVIMFLNKYKEWTTIVYFKTWLTF